MQKNKKMGKSPRETRKKKDRKLKGKQVTHG